jgi:hypothetical protein
MDRGQTVRLNERGLKWQKRAGGGPVRRNDVMWQGRVGVVRRMTADGLRARIVWDANSSMSDALPVTFLEAL